ncbi:MAG: hypothetical protein HYU37_11455 [Acidobacteria bacterium]|nr:hypothetical protein [Acidobacteriota bacterium]
MAGQLALYEPQPAPVRSARRPEPQAPLCAACRAREARYGFQPDRDDPQVERPRTLCFDCFRLEMTRRQEAARTVQARLPLEQTLDALNRRRRRAQIAARKALGL